MSQYRLQVVHVPTGEVAATFTPGERAEVDFLTATVDRAAALGVGFFTREATVRQRLETAATDVLYALKKSVKPPA